MPTTSAMPGEQPKIAVIVPCYRVRAGILGVLAHIGPEVSAIYVVDDACPEHSGALVERESRDPRVRVIRHPVNGGVGRAVLSGFAAALAEGADICVKIDGDGQMDPRLLPQFVSPILDGIADYTKGNRFYYLDTIGRMPPLRLFGNALLSFLTKLSSGYWDIFDPTNGYVAVAAAVARELPFDKISPDYFFESDMLFRLSLIRARVVDIPMHAVYDGAPSSLKIGRVLTTFPRRHMVNFAKRILYNYFVRDFSIASLYLVFGPMLTAFGVLFGLTRWVDGIRTQVENSAGTIMLAALPVILGLQLILSFFAVDVASVPRQPIGPLLARRRGAIRR